MKHPQTLEKSVKAVVGRFDGLPDLAMRLTRFLVEGVFPEVVDELAALQDERALPAWFGHGRHLRTLFHHCEARKDSEFLFRLALVCEAAMPVQGMGTSLLPGWLAILLREMEGSSGWVHASDLGQADPAPTPPLTTEAVEQFLLRRGESPDLLVHACLVATSRFEHRAHPLEWFVGLAGLGERIAAHPEVVQGALDHPTAVGRIRVLEALTRLKLSPLPYLAAVVDAAVCPTRTVRAVAEPLLSGVEEAIPLLERKAREGKQSERDHAMRMLLRMGPPRAARLQESASSVVPGAGEADSPAPVPPRKPPPVLSPETVAALREMIPLVAIPGRGRAGRRAAAHLERDVIERIVSAVQDEARSGNMSLAWMRPARPFPLILLNFLERPDVEMFHVVRLLDLFSFPLLRTLGFFLEFMCECLRAGGRTCDLREIAAALEGLGVSPADVEKGFLSLNFDALGWKDEEILPWFSAHLDLLHSALASPPPPLPGRLPRVYLPGGALDVLRRFPTLPQALVPLLLEQALTGPSSWRPRFQEALARLPGLSGILQEKLRTGLAAERGVAATWLGQVGGPGTVEALQKAAGGDPVTAVQGAALGALERLGIQPETPATAEALTREARAGLKRTRRGLAGPMASAVVPGVRWASGSPASREVAEWLVLRARTLKSPEPDRWLLDAVRLLDPTDRRALALRVLEAWFSPQAEPRFTPQEAQALAEQMARNAFPGRVPTSGAVARRRAHLLRVRRVPDQDERGVLAVVASCGDATVLERTVSYLRDHRLLPRQQICTLLHMLAWIEDLPAEAFLEEVARRDTRDAIRQEARACLEQRRGRQRAGG